jgi:hypothetical protein
MLRRMRRVKRKQKIVLFVIFWVVALCNLVSGYQHFAEACSLHHQDGRTAQKAAVSIPAAARTSHLTKCN